METEMVTRLMRYEQDEDMPEQEVYALFQELINSGAAWQLQGSYGRMAQYLIDMGKCLPKAPTIYEVMYHNYTHGIEEEGVATFLHTLQEPDRMALRYHNTDVVIAYPSGNVWLDSGGFNKPHLAWSGKTQTCSPTTRKRISRYLPKGVSLYQEKYIWWIQMPDGREYEFVDGMQITTDFQVKYFLDDKDTDYHLKQNVLRRMKHGV